MFAYLLPQALLNWIAETVKARVVRWAGIADRQLDQLEAELDARSLFAGAVPIAPEDISTNRIIDAPKNGRRKAAV